MPLFRKDKDGHVWRLEDAGTPRACWTDHLSRSQPYAEGDLQKSALYEAADFDDFVMTCYLAPALDNGWIDREGRFWGCHYHQHNRLVYDVLKKKAGEIERAGWVKVETYNWLCQTRLSPEQKAALRRIGRDAADPRFRDKSVTFAHAFPRGYPLTLLPKERAVRLPPRSRRPGGPAP
jgi:hypothetical protein